MFMQDHSHVPGTKLAHGVAAHPYSYYAEVCHSRDVISYSLGFPNAIKPYVVGTTCTRNALFYRSKSRPGPPAPTV